MASSSWTSRRRSWTSRIVTPRPSPSANRCFQPQYFITLHHMQRHTCKVTLSAQVRRLLYRGVAALCRATDALLAQFLQTFASGLAEAGNRPVWGVGRNLVLQRGEATVARISVARVGAKKKGKRELVG
jgi:hypothetical protein